MTMEKLYSIEALLVAVDARIIHVQKRQEVLERGLADVLFALRKMERHLTKEMDDLQAAVAKVQAGVDAADTELRQIAADFIANKNDPVAIEALASQLTASADKLSAAVAVGTAADPQAPAAGDTGSGTGTGTDAGAGTGTDAGAGTGTDAGAAQQ